MSLTFGFYNSVNGDRKYNAIEMSSIFDGIIVDGVFMSIGDALNVTATGGMGITIGEGRAWFNHTWTLNDSPYPLTVPNSDVLLNQIHAVVLEVNSNTDVRANSFKIVSGTPSSNPQKPTLTKSELVNQYPLAYILVKAGTTSISQADITNAVGTSECPFVTGPLKGMDIDKLVAQWETQYTQWMEESSNAFNTWFQQMEGQLSGDVAGNLQLQINEKAPIAHTSEDATYGLATDILYGHVKLSDTVDSSLTATSGTAASPSAVKTVNDKAEAAMPKAGGTFTGTVAARSQNISGAYIRNIRVQNSASTSQSTNFIIMVRK